jgi:hypothetical protein
VVSTPLKNMSSSVGIILPNIGKVIKAMFQTTNQILFGNCAEIALYIDETNSGTIFVGIFVEDGA